MHFSDSLRLTDTLCDPPKWAPILSCMQRRSTDSWLGSFAHFPIIPQTVSLLFLLLVAIENSVATMDFFPSCVCYLELFISNTNCAGSHTALYVKLGRTCVTIVAKRA